MSGAPEPLPEVSREASPIELERDDALIDLMADTVAYTRDAHRLIAELMLRVRQTDSGASQYAHLHVPGDTWSRLVALSKRELPALAQLKVK